MRYLRDAETTEPIGEATPEQIAASDRESAGGGHFLVDWDGDVVGPQDENQPWAQPVRRVYVED